MPNTATKSLTDRNRCSMSRGKCSGCASNWSYVYFVVAGSQPVGTAAAPVRDVSDETYGGTSVCLCVSDP